MPSDNTPPTIEVRGVSSHEAPVRVTFDELLSLQASGKVHVRATVIRTSLHVALAELAPEWSKP